MKPFAMDSVALRSADVYFFDLDGCIYHTDQPAPGAGEMLALLHSEGKRIGFITNNSRQTAAEIAQKLRGMGFAVPSAEIIAATDATGAYLKERYGILDVKVAGSTSLEGAIRSRGHRVLPLASPDKADAIVIGRDTEFTFAKLQQVTDQASGGALIIAANPDAFHPGPGGRRVPETGALTAAVEAVIGKRIDYVGKPGPYLFQYGMRHYGVEAEQCVMVGDNLHTDIVGGSRAGMATVWISGAGMNQTLDDADRGAMRPDVIVSGMEELVARYGSQSGQYE